MRIYKKKKIKKIWKSTTFRRIKIIILILRIDFVDVFGTEAHSASL